VVGEGFASYVGIVNHLVALGGREQTEERRWGEGERGTRKSVACKKEVESCEVGV